MATKKRVRRPPSSPRRARPTKPEAETTVARQTRRRRTDDEKRAVVQQVLQSGSRTAAMKELKIYPNQFYAWKKQFVDGGAAAARPRAAREGSEGLVDEARRYLTGKSSLLERLRAKRDELDSLIAQLEAD